MEGARDGALEIDDAFGSEGTVDTMLAAEGDGGVGDPLREVPLRGDACREELREGESRFMLAMLGIGDGAGAAARETIFMPLLVFVLAGMKRVNP